MPISQELLDKFRMLHADISVLVGIVVDALSDEQSSKTDWDGGIQLGTPGADFPTTTSTAILTLMGTTLDVADPTEFTIGDTDVGYLIITDGVDTEIVSYDSSNATQFLNLIRGLYGTTQQSWASGVDVHQLLWSHGVVPEFDLEIQRKNYIQQSITGANPSARVGAKLIYRPFDGNYYMFGGHDGATALNDLWKFDPSTNTWTVLSPTGGPPTPRRDFVMELFIGTAGADEIWVNGGWVGATPGHKDTWKYSFSSNAWSTNAAWDLVNWRHSHAAIMWPGSVTEPQQLIIVGGIADVVGRTKSTRSFDGSTWSTLADAPSTLVFGDAAYSGPFDRMIVTTLGTGDGMRCDVFDPNLNGWTVAASPPAKRYYATLVSDTETGEVLMFGGSSSITLPATGSNQLFVYNQASNMWRELAQFSRENRVRHISAWDSANNEMLIWGGRIDASTFPVWPDPAKFRYFWQSAKFRTQTMDLGSVPTSDGEWILEDIKDTIRGLSGVAYTAEWSDDASAFTPIGAVLDGTVITALHRYWRVSVTLTSDGLDISPSVQKINANFDIIDWRSWANKPVDNFAPTIKNISSLSTRVDPIKATSKIGTMTIEILNTSLGAQELVTELFPRGKTVFIKVGVYEGGPFDPADFTDAFKGKVKDWTFDGGVIRMTVEDFLGDLKKDIPEEDSGGVVTPLQYNAGGIAAHPVDIMEDIILNQLNIPDRNVDLDSFETVKSDASLTDWAFNRIISSPEDGHKLLMEISRHIGAVIILREDGTLALKILDPSGDAVDDWDEKTQMFRNVKFNARANDTIRNFVSTWWGWDGSGEEVSDFSGIEVVADSDSVSNWGLKILRTKSKWLGNTANPYFGDARAVDISTRILAMGKNGIPAISLETYLGALPVNAGDTIRIQSSVVKSLQEYIKWQAKHNPQKDLVFVDKTGRYSIPYIAFGVFECIDMKFYVTKKQVNFIKGTIKWELHRAREVPLEKIFTTQADFEQGTGNQVDYTSSPGSVELAIESAPLYFVSGTYELIIDMTQQPERDGVWTLTDATPGDTSIAYAAEASETGDFLGEEMDIGAVVDSDPITLKTRYYKIKAILNASTDLKKTPSIDEIKVTFDNG